MLLGTEHEICKEDITQAYCLYETWIYRNHSGARWVMGRGLRAPMGKGDRQISFWIYYNWDRIQEEIDIPSHIYKFNLLS